MSLAAKAVETQSKGSVLTHTEAASPDRGGINTLRSEWLRTAGGPTDDAPTSAGASGRAASSPPPTLIRPGFLAGGRPAAAPGAPTCLAVGTAVTLLTPSLV